MSPPRARKLTQVVLAQPTMTPARPTAAGAGASVQASPLSQYALDTATLPPGEAPARHGRSGHLAHHSYDDPCNYLG